MSRYDEMMFTPAVEARQAGIGAKGKFASRYRQPERFNIGADEMDFLLSRTTLYIATVSETGWPYIQHRGGPLGFIKQLGDTQVGFADYRGNRQLVSAGNLDKDDRVSIFAMDYARKNRLKLQGHAQMLSIEDNPELAAQLTLMDHPAPERLMVIDIASYDWNCPKYITPRFDTGEMTQLIGPEISRLETRIAELEAENAALRNEGPQK
ncbi:pyridoxamine 5'-phosphate oxidase family protein [Ascidiaceihabitans sp.]|uniref:pyridoxamine 5'-phosphate oxidase family protein n=1 Tax=Ascidiaceihabitans sp. TaxID=1872644 RepID=UPI0032985B56